MTTPTTPYALWRNMPLSHCRAMWLGRNQFATPWATRITVMWLMRECEAQRDQLAAVTAERDALQKQLSDPEGEL